MMFDEAIDAIVDGGAVLQGAEWLLQDWDSTAPLCRALLRDYVMGIDLSERTERALGLLIPLLADRQDAASFPYLCALAADTERGDSVLGEADVVTVMPAVLISTFDGDLTQLHRLVETLDADEMMRGEALLVLAYLARTRRFPARELYDYLAALPDRLQPQEQHYVWFGWVRAVAAMGFAGLSSRAEQLFQQGLVDTTIIGPADFWAELRESQTDPAGMTSRAWEDIGPFGSALDWIGSAAQPIEEVAVEPVRNPLRHVGRNDPCPCGSGRKYKKCCLAA